MFRRMAFRLKFRRRLTVVFGLLMTLSITVSISFAILFIREHLYDNRLAEMQFQADRFHTYLADFPPGKAQWPPLAKSTEYYLRVYKGSQLLFSSFPLDLTAPAPGAFPGHERFIEHRTDDYLLLYRLLDQNQDGVTAIVLAYPKVFVRDALKPMRWIIYTGMLVSSVLGLAIMVVFAHYLSWPILRIRQTTARIADGNFDLLARESRRTDELGDIARSINRMAEHLKQDNERLKALNEKQSQFYADITHEVRNPLHTILTSVEMLGLVGDQPEKRKQYLGIVRSQAERIARLFHDLLLLQKYDAEGAFVNPAWFRVDALLERVEAAYSDRITQKGVAFRIEKPPLEVYADADKIEQVLDNLVSNSAKFTDTGEVHIGCRFAQEHAFITVSDTGLGIAPEHLVRLTDRFYRTDKARTRDKGGTGLGLSVVKSILDAHGVLLDMTSEPEKGTTFGFALPARLV